MTRANNKLFLQLPPEMKKREFPDAYSSHFSLRILFSDDDTSGETRPPTLVAVGIQCLWTLLLKIQFVNVQFYKILWTLILKY